MTCSRNLLGSAKGNRVVKATQSVILAQRVHLFPFRTQKLSSAEVTILAWRRAGKITHRGHNPNGLQNASRITRQVGVSTAEGPPVPIPNTEVKLC